jgi:hypothetical protein
VADKNAFDQSLWAAQVLARINAARATRGQPAITRYDGDRGQTMREANRVTEGRHGLSRAISDATEAGAEGIKFGHVHGWTRETDEPASLPVPEALLTLSQVSIGVGRYRRPGEPWARFVVLLVAPHESKGDLGDDVGVVFSPTIYTK